jgi:hypothetical protein
MTVSSVTAPWTTAETAATTASASAAAATVGPVGVGVLRLLLAIRGDLLVVGGLLPLVELLV